MAIEWTGSGPELLLSVSRGSGRALGAQIQDQLRAAIRTGRLTAGERLPSSRLLAAQLAVSRGLVIEVYQQLHAEGYLDPRPGSATRVASGVPGPDPGGEPAAGPPAWPPSRRLDVDFLPGRPDLASFPVSDWAWALGIAARTKPTALADYGDPAGVPGLRSVLASYLRRVRAVSASAGQIVVCAGFTQGIGLVLAALAESGVSAIGVEDPGHPDGAQIAVRAGLRPVGIPVDDRGVRVDRLTGSGVRAVVLTPAHQTPTGVVLAPERRQALVAWADECDGIIIEDDYDAEFRYDRQPVGAMQGLAPHRVVNIGTVSKSLAPSLRLGWVICPAPLVASVTRHKELADRGTPAIDQLALARLIESGRFDRHLRRMRGVYARRRACLAAVLRDVAAHVGLSGLSAGFHAVAYLRPGAAEDAVTAAARDRGVGLYGLRRYRLDDESGEQGLVIGFGNVTERAIVRGVTAIADLL